MMCLLGVKAEEACWALINDSSDSMGGGKTRTELSSVCCSCSLKNTDMD